LYVFFAFVSPAAIGIYFLVSTLWRVGQQAYITRSLYRGEDSVGAQAQRAMIELRESRKKDGSTATGQPKSSGKASSAANSGNGSAAGKGKAQPPVARRASARGAGAGSGASAPKPHPRSRKKRKRK
jgi:hypothetical protein